MRNVFRLAIATMALACAIAPAQAAESEGRFQTAQGGVVCQLSIPTTDTKVRPKASGFRNEGTTSAFTICGIPSANDNPEGGSVVSINISFQNLGEAPASFSCTAANGASLFAMAYSTKEVSIDAGGEFFLEFTASDFGGTDGESLPNSDFWSITCNLPGQTAVPYLYSEYSVETTT
jgi:hypothetical protein